MCKFKAGDKVKVIRKVEKEDGWINNWIEEMDEMIGNVYEVKWVNKNTGIHLSCDYNFPHSSLELVEGNSMKTFSNEDKIPFKDLTAKQQHIIIDAIANGNVECYDRITKQWLKGPTNHIMLNNCYRIKPTKKLVIPWEYIKLEYKYAAMDENKRVYIYDEKKPYPDKTSGWWRCEQGNYICLNDIMSIDTTDIDWENSLVKRPD